MRYTIVLSLVFACVVPLVVPAPGYCRQDREPESRKLREDIQIVNLLNNLELSREQAQWVIARAKEVRRLRDSLQQKAVSSEAVLADSYAVIKKQVQAGRVVVDQDDARRFHKIKTELEGAFHQAQARTEEIAVEVEGCLEPYQLAALDAYRPCVIPVVSEGRIGQAGSSDGICRLLERAQRMPSATFDRKKKELAAFVVEKLKIRRAVTRAEETSLQDKVLAALEEARSMDPADFEIRKAALADKLSEEVLPERRDISRRDKIKTFLLSSNVISLLEERYGRLT
ncbi:MAG: hypothetical protein PHS61_03810 [Candidatus Omnitrophica bacterium]|nr:hypothetical protein [Candidatus Omnitrophota bacterium]